MKLMVEHSWFCLELVDRTGSMAELVDRIGLMERRMIWFEWLVDHSCSMAERSHFLAAVVEVHHIGFVEPEHCSWF